VADSTILIANVRPALLGTYGDGGNAIVLRERLRRRGHDAEIVSLDGNQLIPAGSQLVTFGGGEDDAQVIAARDEALRASLHAAIDAGAVVFAVCAGFQLLGETFEVGPGTQVAGFGVLDCRSDRLPQRAVGEIMGNATVGGVGVLTGFENHGGRTVLGPDAQPLARLDVGVGNDGGGGEGAAVGNVFATYLHGPVLARNPALADALLERVVGPLAPIDDPLIDVLRDQRLAAARTRGARTGSKGR
jgi:CobQ-like glutamine amidotransferase family enzyme